jgi:hypothetical protein
VFLPLCNLHCTSRGRQCRVLGLLGTRLSSPRVTTLLCRALDHTSHLSTGGLVGTRGRHPSRSRCCIGSCTHRPQSRSTRLLRFPLVCPNSSSTGCKVRRLTDRWNRTYVHHRLSNSRSCIGRSTCSLRLCFGKLCLRIPPAGRSMQLGNDPGGPEPTQPPAALSQGGACGPAAVSWLGVGGWSAERAGAKDFLNGPSRAAHQARRADMKQG